MQIYNVHVPLLHQYLTLWLFILCFLILMFFKSKCDPPPHTSQLKTGGSKNNLHCSKKIGKNCQWEQILPVFNLVWV